MEYKTPQNSPKKPQGKAYAFFNCRAEAPQIKNELEFIRPLIGVPKSLELELTSLPKINPEGDILLAREKECSEKKRYRMVP